MDAMQQFGAVAVVLALLSATLWWLRRRGFSAALPRKANGRRLQTLERLPLGPQHTLHLVRMEDETLLVACSPAGCVLLTRSGESHGTAVRQAAA